MSEENEDKFEAVKSSPANRFAQILSNPDIRVCRYLHSTVSSETLISLKRIRKEEHKSGVANYFGRPNQMYIAPKDREQCVEWIISVCAVGALSPSVAHLAIQILDRFASETPLLHPPGYRASAATSIFIALKTVQNSRFYVREFGRWLTQQSGMLNDAASSSNLTTTDLLFSTELEILNKLDFKVSLPTSADVLTLLVSAAGLRGQRHAVRVAFALIDLLALNHATALHYRAPPDSRPSSSASHHAAPSLHSLLSPRNAIRQQQAGCGGGVPGVCNNTSNTRRPHMHQLMSPSNITRMMVNSGMDTPSRSLIGCSQQQQTQSYHQNNVNNFNNNSIINISKNSHVDSTTPQNCNTINNQIPQASCNTIYSNMKRNVNSINNCNNITHHTNSTSTTTASGSVSSFSAPLLPTANLNVVLPVLPLPSKFENSIIYPNKDISTNSAFSFSAFESLLGPSSASQTRQNFSEPTEQQSIDAIHFNEKEEKHIISNNNNYNNSNNSVDNNNIKHPQQQHPQQQKVTLHLPLHPTSSSSRLSPSIPLRTPRNNIFSPLNNAFHNNASQSNVLNSSNPLATSHGSPNMSRRLLSVLPAPLRTMHGWLDNLNLSPSRIAASCLLIGLLAERNWEEVNERNNKSREVQNKNNQNKHSLKQQQFEKFEDDDLNKSRSNDDCTSLFSLFSSTSSFSPCSDDEQPMSHSAPAFPCISSSSMAIFGLGKNEMDIKKDFSVPASSTSSTSTPATAVGGNKLLGGGNNNNNNNQLNGGKDSSIHINIHLINENNDAMMKGVFTDMNLNNFNNKEKKNTNMNNININNCSFIHNTINKTPSTNMNNNISNVNMTSNIDNINNNTTLINTNTNKIIVPPQNILTATTSLSTNISSNKSHFHATTSSVSSSQQSSQDISFLFNHKDNTNNHSNNNNKIHFNHQLISKNNKRTHNTDDMMTSSSKTTVLPFCPDALSILGLSLSGSGCKSLLAHHGPSQFHRTSLTASSIAAASTLPPCFHSPSVRPSSMSANHQNQQILLPSPRHAALTAASLQQHPPCASGGTETTPPVYSPFHLPSSFSSTEVYPPTSANWTSGMSLEDSLLSLSADDTTAVSLPPLRPFNNNNNNNTIASDYSPVNKDKRRCQNIASHTASAPPQPSSTSANSSLPNPVSSAAPPLSVPVDDTIPPIFELLGFDSQEVAGDAILITSRLREIIRQSFIPGSPLCTAVSNGLRLPFYSLPPFYDAACLRPPPPPTSTNVSPNAPPAPLPGSYPPNISFLDQGEEPASIAYAQSNPLSYPPVPLCLLLGQPSLHRSLVHSLSAPLRIMESRPPPLLEESRRLSSCSSTLRDVLPQPPNAIKRSRAFFNSITNNNNSMTSLNNHSSAPLAHSFSDVNKSHIATANNNTTHNTTTSLENKSNVNNVNNNNTNSISNANNSNSAKGMPLRGRLALLTAPNASSLALNNNNINNNNNNNNNNTYVNNNSNTFTINNTVTSSLTGGISGASLPNAIGGGAKRVKLSLGIFSSSASSSSLSSNNVNSCKNNINNNITINNHQYTSGNTMNTNNMLNNIDSSYTFDDIQSSNNNNFIKKESDLFSIRDSASAAAAAISPPSTVSSNKDSSSILLADIDSDSKILFNEIGATRIPLMLLRTIRSQTLHPSFAASCRFWQSSPNSLPTSPSSLTCRAPPPAPHLDINADALLASSCALCGIHGGITPVGLMHCCAVFTCDSCHVSLTTLYAKAGIISPEPCANPLCPQYDGTVLSAVLTLGCDPLRLSPSEVSRANKGMNSNSVAVCTANPNTGSYGIPASNSCGNLGMKTPVSSLAPPNTHFGNVGSPRNLLRDASCTNNPSFNANSNANPSACHTAPPALPSNNSEHPLRATMNPCSEDCMSKDELGLQAARYLPEVAPLSSHLSAGELCKAVVNKLLLEIRISDQQRSARVLALRISTSRQGSGGELCVLSNSFAQNAFNQQQQQQQQFIQQQQQHDIAMDADNIKSIVDNNSAATLPPLHDMGHDINSYLQK